MKKLLPLTFFFVMFVPSIVFARWTGPEVAASGTWGKGDNQFTVESTDMGEIYPTEFFVLDDGTVVIEDGKLKIYRNGQFTRALSFDGRVSFCNKAIVVVPWAREDGKPVDQDISFYPSGGNTAWKVPAKRIAGRLDWVNRDCTFVTKDQDKIYRRYSPTGELLETKLHPEKVKHEFLNGHYRFSITYDDVVYMFVHKDEYPYERYVQDRSKLLYGINGRNVDVLDQCGKIIDHITLPEGMKFEGDEDDGQGQFVHDEYGEPFVEAHGNMYTWKRTPASFSILKWKRQASVAPSVPDPPLEPLAMSTSSGLYVTWKQSPQDPGCVTGYEVSRSTDWCGPFTPIATVERGVLKYKDLSAERGTTSHYRVRALAGKTSSAYTTTPSSGKVACPGESPYERLSRYFEEKIYTADKRPYAQDDVEVWKTGSGVFTGDDKKLIVKALRNEIYARHGRAFESPELKRIFEAVSWYQPRNNFSDSELTAIEKKNVEFIVQYEKTMRWR